MRTDFREERDRTKESVSQIAIWCIVIATHQRYSVGAGRLPRVAEAMDGLRQRYVMYITNNGQTDALKWLHDQLPAGCRTDFRVPLNRAVRNRREEQLRMAADQAAGVAWCLWAAALYSELGFGTTRLEVIRREGIANYRQFNQWCCEDKEWAFDRLRRCAEAAVGERMYVTDEDEPEPAHLVDDGLRDEERRAVQLAVNCRMGRAERPAGWAVLNQQTVIAKMEEMRNDQNRNHQPKGWCR